MTATTTEATTTTTTAKAPRKGKSKTTVKAEANGKAARPDDGCRAAARGSGGKYTTDQIRILDRLAKCKSPASRADLKEMVGIGREGKYSQAWLNGLKTLEAAKLIKVTVSEEARGYFHEITARGRETVKKLLG